ncbi:Uncharacterised protein [Pantoea agglomerans]|nr:Uncharacterised protein [Pantoea agglomerans]
MISCKRLYIHFDAFYRFNMRPFRLNLKINRRLQCRLGRLAGRQDLNRVKKGKYSYTLLHVE